ncbi:hypothetical protein BC834DRAFT_863809, partial [Gloeopeniophorella convolvens]
MGMGYDRFDCILLIGGRAYSKHGVASSPERKSPCEKSHRPWPPVHRPAPAFQACRSGRRITLDAVGWERDSETSDLRPPAHRIVARRVGSGRFV